MTSIGTPADRAIAALTAAGKPMTAGELAARGLSMTALRRLEANGTLERAYRGVYRLPHQGQDERSVWADVAVRNPRMVVCLLSAAALHRITQEMPNALQVAVPHDLSGPAAGTGPKVDVVRWRRPELFSIGVQEVNIDGVAVRVTNPERTVVDLFRHYGGESEVYLDALHRLLDPETHVGSPRGIAPLARELGAWERMRPTVKAASYAISTGYGA